MGVTSHKPTHQEPRKTRRQEPHTSKGAPSTEPQERHRRDKLPLKSQEAAATRPQEVWRWNSFASVKTASTCNPSYKFWKQGNHPLHLCIEIHFLITFLLNPMNLMNTTVLVTSNCIGHLTTRHKVTHISRGVATLLQTKSSHLVIHHYTTTNYAVLKMF